MPSKPASALSYTDIEEHPVWRYKDEAQLAAHEDEGWVESVDPHTPDDPYGYFFASSAHLADGTTTLVLVGGTEPCNAQYNETSQFFVFFHNDRKLRWHPQEDSAAALASFLEKTAAAVLPFTVDLSCYLVGDPAAVRRRVCDEGAARR